MYYFTVKAHAPTVSFRIPETHTFQQTLPLPPVTTLTGLMGAAGGLEFEEAMRFREDNGIYFGVLGTHKGKFNDLWKYYKFKYENKSIKVVSAVLIREYLTDFSIQLVIAAEDSSIVQKVREYFLNPWYALTAGNSDDLLKVAEVGEVVQSELLMLSDFENTVIAGDVSGNYESNIDLESLPIMESIYAPQVHLLPTKFNFNNGERRVNERAHFSFIDTPIKLKEPVPALLVEDKAVSLI